MSRTETAVEAAPIAASPPGARRGLVIAAITAAYAVVLLVRRPAALTDPTIWAEDGRLFLGGALNAGPDLLSVTAGQLWTLQRLIAAALAPLPAGWWPLALLIVSCVGAALMVAVVLSERAKPLLGGFWFRAATGALLVMLPGVWEVHGNLANLHWWATVAAMVLLAMQPPRSLLGRGVEILFIGVVALTGLGGLLLVPVALWRLVAGPRSVPLVTRSVLVFAAGAVNIAVAARYSDRAGASDPVGALPTMIDFVHIRVAQVFLVGERGLANWQVVGSVLAIAAVVLLALVAVLILSDLRGPSWAWAATGLATIALAMASVPTDERALVLQPYISGRYTLLAAAAMVLVVMRGLGLGALFRRIVAAAALVLMIPGMAVDAYLSPLGPGVPEAELSTFQACLDGATEYADDPFCFVDIQPDTGEWRIVVWRDGVDREQFLN